MAIKKLLKAAKDAAQREPEPPKAPPVHDEGWLVSYADMMTLLCGFFIMMFSMANMDPPKYEKVAEALSAQFGGEYKSPSEDLGKFVTQVINEAAIDAQTSIKIEGLGVTVTFQSTLFFDTLSADVKPDGYKVLERLTKELYARQEKDHKVYHIVVEGHTDSRPILAGTFPSNWELSGARASRVIRFFLDQKFKPDHLTSIGYADTRPEVNPRRADGSFDEGLLGKNRRVVVRILSDAADSIPMPKGEAVTHQAVPAGATPAVGAVQPQAGATAQTSAAQGVALEGAPVKAAAVAAQPPAAAAAPVAPSAAQAPVRAPASAPAGH